MGRKRSQKVRTCLTDRALRDIAEIERYSIREFGRKTADHYREKLEAAITRITENPDLLRSEPEFHSWLRFYRIEEHLMVCEFEDSGTIMVLTLIHATMDIPSRLMELEPTLLAETELLHQQLRSRK